MIAFASSFPGSVKAFEISPGNEMILQKNAFLAGEAGVELSIFFNKKLGAGLFGGEGFIMQKLSGRGIVFAEFDGHIMEYDLCLVYNKNTQNCRGDSPKLQREIPQ